MPGGFLTVMRRAEPVDRVEWWRNKCGWYNKARGLCVPVENKLDSWGMVDGRVVAVDYGSNYRSGYEEVC